MGMKQTIFKWIWSIITLASVVVIIMGTAYYYNVMSETYKPDIEPPKKNAVPVEVTPVERRTLSQRIIFNATVEPFFAVEIQPKIGGRLVTLQTSSGEEIIEGTHVQAGEIIAELDKAQLEADVNFASASLESVKSNVELARVNLEENKREMQRQEVLTQRGAGTSQEYDKSKTAYERAIAQLRQAVNSVEKENAALKQSQVKLADATIYAPQTGVITKKYLHPGAYVSTMTPIVAMMSVDTVKISIQVPQNYLPFLREGETIVRLESENWPQTYDGIVTKIFPAIDDVTRSCTVHIYMQNVNDDNGQMRYRPGMYLTASIMLQTHENTLAVPMDLLVRNSDKYYLFREKGNIAESVEVKLGIRDGIYAEIVDGLKDGDRIISNGQFRLTDGTAIHALNSGK